VFSARSDAGLRRARSLSATAPPVRVGGVAQGPTGACHLYFPTQKRFWKVNDKVRKVKHRNSRLENKASRLGFLPKRYRQTVFFATPVLQTVIGPPPAR